MAAVVTGGLPDGRKMSGANVTEGGGPSDL